jgi:hypothetical protein
MWPWIALAFVLGVLVGVGAAVIFFLKMAPSVKLW